MKKQPVKKSAMRNPKIVNKQNPKRQWTFKVKAKGGESFLIGGETLKNKPTQKMLVRFARKFLVLALQNKIEYLPYKK